MVESFLSKLTCRDSIPLDSLLVAYNVIAQCGLEIVDAHIRMVLDFVLTINQAIRYAEKEIFLQDRASIPPPCHAMWPFPSAKSDTSNFLHTLYHLVTLVGTHTKCVDPVAFFLKYGSFNSSRDRIKKEASKWRRNSLNTIASPSLKALLSELLIE